MKCQSNRFKIFCSFTYNSWAYNSLSKKMAALSIKGLIFWFSNMLLPFVLMVNFQNTIKDGIRTKIEVFTSNANLLYFILLIIWTFFNLVNLWIKFQLQKELLKKQRIETALKELQLKNKENETT
jgi:hypothetical protein